MKKEILITILCTSLMLVTPFTSIAQENKVSNNLPEQPNDVDGLVVQIRTVVNDILVKYGHIPLVRSLCNMINNILSWYPGNILYCILLFILAVPLASLLLIIGWWYRNLFYLVILILHEFDSNCPPKTPFFFDWSSSFQSIYTMLETKDNLTNTFDGCPCLQE